MNRCFPMLGIIYGDRGYFCAVYGEVLGAARHTIPVFTFSLTCCAPVARTASSFAAIFASTHSACPSPKSTFTPPGCRLDADTCIAMFTMPLTKGNPAHEFVFGVETWLYCVQHISPITQLIP